MDISDERSYDGFEAAKKAMRSAMTRRTVLKGAAALGAGGVLSGSTLGASMAGASSVEPHATLPLPPPRQGAGKKHLLVYATHFYYGQPEALELVDGLRDFADQAGWEFRFFVPQGSGDVQEVQTAFELGLAAKPDIAIITQNDPTAYNQLIKQYMKTTPYVALCNTEPTTGNPFGLPYVGPVAYDTGVTVGNAIIDVVVGRGHKAGDIVVGRACPTCLAITLRIAGVNSAITAYNKKNATKFVSVTFDDQSDTDLMLSTSLWETKLRAAGSSLVAAIADSDGTPQITALKALHYKPGVVASAMWDVTADKLPLMSQGWLDVISDQQTYAQGWISASMGWQQYARGIAPLSLYDTNAIATRSEIALLVSRTARLAQLAVDYGYKV